MGRGARGAMCMLNVVVQRTLQEILWVFARLVILPFLFSVSHFYTSPLNFLCSYDKKREASVLRQQDFSLLITW